MSLYDNNFERLMTLETNEFFDLNSDIISRYTKLSNILDAKDVTSFTNYVISLIENELQQSTIDFLEVTVYISEKQKIPVYIRTLAKIRDEQFIIDYNINYHYFSNKVPLLMLKSIYKDETEF